MSAHHAKIQTTLEDINILIRYSHPQYTHVTTPWNIQPTKCILKLSRYTKNKPTHKSTYMNLTLRHNRYSDYSNYRFIFTNASKATNNTGAAIVDNKTMIKMKLPSLLSIYSAELHCLPENILYISKENSNQSKYFTCTDSLIVLTPIQQLFPNNRTFRTSFTR